MYLMDSIIETAAWVTDSDATHLQPVTIYPILAKQLQGTPRFLLDNNAIHTAVELTFGRPKIMLEALAHLRIPYPRMWVEWSEEGRANLRAKFPENDRLVTPGRPIPQRVGFLLESDNGRVGTATWAWQSPAFHVPGFDDDFNPPNVGLISAYFDLDKRIPLKQERREGLLRGNLACLWKNNPVQLEALYGIWETAEHNFSDWGADYFISNPERLDIGACYADVFGEYIMIWAIMLLLTSERPIINYIKVDNSRLNKARAKRRELPRLDHTRITLHLDPTKQVLQKRAPLGYTRKSPRVHMVSRYLARRGNRHWIVEPYWRGQGETISRHITVKR